MPKSPPRRKRRPAPPAMTASPASAIVTAAARQQVQQAELSEQEISARYSSIVRTVARRACLPFALPTAVIGSRSRPNFAGPRRHQRRSRRHRHQGWPLSASMLKRAGCNPTDQLACLAAMRAAGAETAMAVGRAMTAVRVPEARGPTATRAASMHLRWRARADAWLARLANLGVRAQRPEPSAPVCNRLAFNVPHWRRFASSNRAGRARCSDGACKAPGRRRSRSPCRSQRAAASVIRRRAGGATLEAAADIATRRSRFSGLARGCTTMSAGTRRTER